MAVQHRQQHGESIAIQAHRQTPRARAAAVHQGLNFHQHGAGAFECDQHTTARYWLTVLAQKNGAGVAHPFEAALGHGKHANFIDRAKTVFDGPHQPVGGVRVAFEIQHRVHHVLEHTRASQRALLGDVPDQNDGGAGAFGHARQMGRAFAHLGHRARGAGQLVRVDRLDRVHDHHGGLQFVDRGEHFFQLGFGQHLHLAVVQPEAP